MELLEFKPQLKRARWGGRKLATLLHKPLGDKTDYAESWEISDVPGSGSIVKEGKFAGKSLHQLLQKYPGELLGQAPTGERFPLLIKFLDAHDRLSVQVHPNDEQARQLYHAPFGKTECWIILSAEPSARLFVGLRQGIDRAYLEKAIHNNKIENCLHEIAVQPGDFVFVPAGTVHAIGEGIVLAEIQQTSDITFRLHDWGRLGHDGKPRELHIDEALGCIDFQRGTVSPTRTKIDHTAFGTVEELVSCEQFEVRQFNLREVHKPPTDGIMLIWMVLSGNVVMESAEQKIDLQTGNCVLAPAITEEYHLAPKEKSTLLEVTAHLQ